MEYLTIEEESTVNDPSEWVEVEVEVEVEEEKVAIPTFDLVVFLFLSRSAPIQSFSLSSNTREEIALVPLLQKMPGLVILNLKVVASQRSIEQVSKSKSKYCHSSRRYTSSIVCLLLLTRPYG